MNYTAMVENIPFNKRMRLATKEIHDISDAMINAKLAFAMSDNSVWAEGLLVFYEIFRYLEEAMVRLKGTPVGEFKFEELMRTEAFQKDLAFYLGEDWTKTYSPRESVAKYLLHLQKVEKENPTLLVAYIYHMYMGLLSGGQILAKKRALEKKLFSFGRKTENNGAGVAITSFGDHSISSLKKRIVDTTNSIAVTLDNDTKEKLLEESKMVFTLNNAMVRTIKGTSFVLFKKVMMLFLIILMMIAFYFML